jgi:hypothetical protein
MSSKEVTLVLGRVVPGISNDHGAFKTPGIIHLITQHYFPAPQVFKYDKVTSYN